MNFMNFSPVANVPRKSCHIYRIMPHCVLISANALNGFRAAALFSTMWSKLFKSHI